MSHTIETRQVASQRIATVRGTAVRTSFPVSIRALFDEFYAGFKGKGGLNIVTYSACDASGSFEIECGVQVEEGGNSSTPAGLVVTTAYFGPYEKLSQAHDALHRWARENHRRLAGPSWEIYGHWTDDSSQLRTDIYYLLAE